MIPTNQPPAEKPDRPETPLSPLKRAFLALQAAQLRVEELESEISEPIAIIGIGCRFPGCGEGIEGYWKLLLERRVAVGDGVEQRFIDIGCETPLPEAARRAGLLDRVDEFDPRHFGISPREAAGIDPQQRILLETSWQALEDAGIDPLSLSKSRTGVFVGICSHDYAQLELRDPDHHALSPHFASGIASSVASGRIAYVLGLNGPAVSIDTACSSSLVAVHLACAALRRGECSMALAGGVNLILSPEFSIAFAQAGMLSPQGLCRTFDEAADGFVRGEGCGVVVLKRLRDAEAQGDRILALIPGSAINQDGATSGLTVPNGNAQQDLLRQAHQNARVSAWQVGYVEAHGTGTTLGDPIEAEALGAVFASGRKRDRPLLVGAVKTNLGHLEAAAGVAGLIKVVLSLRHGLVPGHPHLNALNPHVRWGALPIGIAKETQPWPETGGRRIAGVSSFGFSGTNAHVVLEGYQAPPRSETESQSDEVLVISARTPAALRQLVERYVAFLSGSDYTRSEETRSDYTWFDICLTAATGRAVFAERLAVVAGDKAAAARKLRAWLTQDIVPAGLFQGQGSAGEAAPLPQASGADLKPVEFAEAFVRGSQVDWRAVSQGRKYRRVALPGYPFQRERYWIDSPRANFPSAAFPAPAPLLGTRLHVAGVLAQFQTELQVGGSTAWIGQHVMDGRTVFPLSAHLELALEAAAQLLGPGATVEDLILRSPLVVDQACTVQVVVGHQVDGRHLLRVYAAQTNHEWTSVSECRLRPSPDAGAARPAQELLDGASLRARLAEDSDVAGFYARMAAGGAAFGPKFQGLTRIWSGPGEAMGEVNSPGAGEGYIFAPWQLDACLQLIGCVRGDQDLYLPSSVGGIGVYGTPGARCWSHLQCRRVDNDTLSADVTIARDDETVIAVIREIIFRKLAVKKNDASSLFYRLRWHPDAASSPASNVRPIQKAILLGSSPRIPGIAAELRAHGVTVQLLPPDAHRDTVSISPDTDAVLCFSSPSDRVGEDRVGEDRVGEDRVGEELLPGQVARRMEKNVRLVLAAAQAMLRSEAAAAPRLYVITRDACPAIDDSPEPVHLNHTPLVGMANAIAIEAPELRCTLIDDTSGDPGTPAPSLAGEILAGREDQRVAFRAGVRYTARLERVPSSEMPATDSESAALTLATGIEALSYKTRERPEPGPDEVEIAVRATALNFRDVLKATGLLDHAGSVGTDCAGVISRVGSQVSGLRSGDPVVAIAPGCFADYVVTPASLVVRKPARLSFESAAAQTVAYLTADYCLHELARVRKGERVLIHAAAGGVGLAAVHLCRQAGAEVIATAGSKAKRDWLRSLGIDHVFDSRSTAFRERIADGVFADGVDIVLNSLAGPAIDAGLATLRANGRFIELGKTDLRPVEEIRLRWPGITYIQADLTPLFNERSPWVAEHMTALLTAIEAAALPALPLTVFERAETRQAFRHMAAARHIGRVVIRSGPRDVSAGAHLITGGLGGIGLSLAEWLVAAGARDLVLAGRHGVSLESSRAIAKLEALGATVRVFQSDLADWDNARRLVAACGDALRGVWHCAGVIDDAILPEQSWVRFAGVLAPKTDGAWNLHLLTQASKLDFFVLFSSWASLAGSRGQANYCAANAFLDGLAAFRRAGGLPALSVNWGAWSHTGLASGEVVQRHLERSGMHAMQPELALAALGLALRMGEPGLAIALVDWPKYLAQIPPSQRGFYTDLLLESQNASPRAPSSGKQSPAHPESASDTLATNGRALLSLITSALPADRAATVQRVIEDVIRRTLALRSSDRIDPHESFSDLGMDSLLAVELRNSLSTILERRLPSAIVFDYPTVKKLARFVENELYPAQPAIAKPEYETRRNLEMESADALTPMSLLDQIEELSDEEVDSIFDDGSSGRFRLAK